MLAVGGAGWANKGRWALRLNALIEINNRSQFRPVGQSSSLSSRLLRREPRGFRMEQHFGTRHTDTENFQLFSLKVNF